MGDPATELCTRCGLCCNGVLFDVVRLAPPEIERMTRLGLPVLPRTENPAMAQPCAALEGTRCRVYADRPARCGEFRCHLLVKFPSFLSSPVNRDAQRLICS